MAEEHADPLAQHRAVMAHLLEEQGAQAIIDYIQGFDSPPLRRVLYIAAKEVLAPQDFVGKRLDELIEVSDAGVAEMLRQAETAKDDEERMHCLHGAHIVSYNLAAELADCWPGDDLPRTEAHHRRGVKAADDCLSWSEPAGRPGPIANDYWARGMHELALGETSAAVVSWTKALDFAIQAAEANGRSNHVGPDGTFLVNLTAGYLGLARWLTGDKRGEAEYEPAVAAFREQLKKPALTDDADMGLGQLEKTRKQHGPEGAL